MTNDITKKNIVADGRSSKEESIQLEAITTSLDLITIILAAEEEMMIIAIKVVEAKAHGVEAEISVANKAHIQVINIKKAVVKAQEEIYR